MKTHGEISLVKLLRACVGAAARWLASPARMFRFAALLGALCINAYLVVVLLAGCVAGGWVVRLCRIHRLGAAEAPGKRIGALRYQELADIDVVSVDLLRPLATYAGAQRKRIGTDGTSIEHFRIQHRSRDRQSPQR